MAIEKRFVVLTVLEGSKDNVSEVKYAVDVTSIDCITEVTEPFGFKTTLIVFEGDKKSVYVRSSIEDTIKMLKKAEPLLDSFSF